MDGALAGAGLLVLAAVLLAGGAELFVENLARAAHRLGLTVLATGLLLAGAEPEEALTGVLASLRGRPELAAGDAVGANVTMLTAALGLAALARPLPVGRRVREYAAGSVTAGLLALVALADATVTRGEGVLLLVVYVAMVAWVWRRDRRPPALGELAELDDDLEERRDGDPGDGSGSEGSDGSDGPARGAGRGLLLAVAGLLVMTVGGAVAVFGAERLVAGLGVGDDAVGLTALALATTAELFALVVAALRRGVAEIAVAGVVGSAAYNATVSLGLAASVHPLEGVGGVRSAAVAAALLPLVVVAAGARGRLGRPAGSLLAVGYVGYVLLVAL